MGGYNIATAETKILQIKYVPRAKNTISIAYLNDKGVNNGLQTLDNYIAMKDKFRNYNMEHRGKPLETLREQKI